jgi:hypothetical protein
VLATKSDEVLNQREENRDYYTISILSRNAGVPQRGFETRHPSIRAMIEINLAR